MIAMASGFDLFGAAGMGLMAAGLWWQSVRGSRRHERSDGRNKR